MIDIVKNYLLLALTALCVVMGLATWHYATRARALSFALNTQNAAIEAQNDAAKKLLDTRTRERDELQEKMDQRAAAQEKKDGTALRDIAADDKHAASEPVRVRCQPSAPRPGGGGTASRPAAPAQAGAGDDRTTYGVLPTTNSGRLKAVISEIEILNAAYASCRATLIKE